MLFRFSAGPPFECENAGIGWVIELPCFSCVNDVMRPSGDLLLTKLVGGDFNVMLVRTFYERSRKNTREHVNVYNVKRME